MCRPLSCTHPSRAPLGRPRGFSPRSPGPLRQAETACHNMWNGSRVLLTNEIPSTIPQPLTPIFQHPSVPPRCPQVKLTVKMPLGAFGSLQDRSGTGLDDWPRRGAGTEAEGSLTCVRSVDSRSSTLPPWGPRGATHTPPEALRGARRSRPAQISRKPVRKCLETRAYTMGLTQELA